MPGRSGKLYKHTVTNVISFEIEANVLGNSLYVAMESYRYGFNGIENDFEWGIYAAEYRFFDSRLGRWLSPDPIFHPHMSPYVGMDANPVVLSDPYGLATGDPPTTRTDHEDGTSTLDDGKSTWRVPTSWLEDGGGTPKDPTPETQEPGGSQDTWNDNETADNKDNQDQTSPSDESSPTPKQETSKDQGNLPEIGNNAPTSNTPKPDRQVEKARKENLVEQEKTPTVSKESPTTSKPNSTRLQVSMDYRGRISASGNHTEFKIKTSTVIGAVLALSNSPIGKVRASLLASSPSTSYSSVFFRELSKIGIPYNPLNIKLPSLPSVAPNLII
jgi:RHS repeat-associated protein